MIAAADLPLRPGRTLEVRGSGSGRPRKGKWTPGPSVSAEDAQRIIDAAETERDRLLVWTLFATGARVGEVVQLTRFGLVDGKTIRLPLEKNRSRHWNDITLWPEDRELLFYLQRFADQVPTGAYIFAGRREGEHLSVRAARNVFAACATRAGVMVFEKGQLRPAHPHTGRHTRTRLDLARGLALPAIQAQRGWARLDHGMAYMTPTPDQVGDMMERL